VNFGWFLDGSMISLFRQTLSIEDETIMEFAPKFVKKLPERVKTHEKEVTKFEVKVIGQPKPEGKWLKEGEEIFPSEEFLIENFNDGTSILIINDIYPDDTGTITFEAHNALGVAMTTTELVVEGIHIMNALELHFLQFFLFKCLYSLYFQIFFYRFFLPNPNFLFISKSYTQTLSPNTNHFRTHYLFLVHLIVDRD
jgi:Immunoglobulin I-set domain